MSETRLVGDLTTGEVLFEVGDGYTVRMQRVLTEAEKIDREIWRMEHNPRAKYMTRQQKEDVVAKVSYDFGERPKGFSMMSSYEMSKLIPELSSDAVKMLTLFGSWLQHSGLIYNGYKRDVSYVDLEKALGMTRKKVVFALKELREKRIIMAVPDGKKRRYIMNPYLMGKGKGFPPIFRELFEDYQFRSRGMKTVKEIYG